VAEGDAALHAPCGLLLQNRQVERAHELAEVADPLARIALGLLHPLILEEAAELAHRLRRLLGLGGDEPAAGGRGIVALGLNDSVGEGALVIVRDHLHEPRQRRLPLGQESGRDV
jgi:hypothetical protein